MRIGQILAQAPSTCPRVSIVADVFYGSPRRYKLKGYAYGEVGAITQRVTFTDYADQTEFTEREFDQAMQHAGFHMPDRPYKNSGLQYTYVLRPVPTAQEGPPPEFSFNIKSGSLGYAEEKAREERLIEMLERQMTERAAAEAVDF